jgi:hypothetical protein
MISVFSVKVPATLQADDEQFRDRLQLFAELMMAKEKVVPVDGSSVDTSPDLYPLLSREEAREASLDFESLQTMRAILQVRELESKLRRLQGDPEPSAAVPVEMESSARQRLEDDADVAARAMVLSFELMTGQGQSTATSLARALRIAGEASLAFESPQTLAAILLALDLMDAAAREEQSNG